MGLLQSFLLPLGPVFLVSYKRNWSISQTRYSRPITRNFYRSINSQCMFKGLWKLHFASDMAPNMPLTILRGSLLVLYQWRFRFMPLLTTWPSQIGSLHQTFMSLMIWHRDLLGIMENLIYAQQKHISLIKIAQNWFFSVWQKWISLRGST